ncbi:MAG: hypothetical protein ACRCTZ_07920 [Sarcina sp.]
MKKLILGLFLIGSVCSFSLSNDCVYGHRRKTHKVIYIKTNDGVKAHEDKVNKFFNEFKGEAICSIRTEYPSAIITEIVYVD